MKTIKMSKEEKIIFSSYFSIRKLVKLGFILLLWSNTDMAYSQTVAWPKNGSYDFGFKPSVANSNDATTDYGNWVNMFVTSYNAWGKLRVKYPQSSNFQYTTSEGIGYGMILSAYKGDKNVFDNLCGWFMLHKNNQGLMQWKNDINGNCSGWDCNAATDADQDI